MDKITVRYSSVDWYSKTRYFKTIEGARKWAQKMVGERPEISTAFQYAVSGDGVGKITVRGATLKDLFPGSGDQEEPETLLVDVVCDEYPRRTLFPTVY